MTTMGRTAALVTSAAALMLVTGCGPSGEPDAAPPTTSTTEEVMEVEARLAQAEQRAEEAEQEIREILAQERARQADWQGQLDGLRGQRERLAGIGAEPSGSA